MDAKQRAQLAEALQAKAQLSVDFERSSEALQRARADCDEVRVQAEEAFQRAAEAEARAASANGGGANNSESKGGSGASGGNSSSDHAAEVAELAAEVKLWRRKHRELSDLSDEAYAIMSEQLQEKDAALAQMDHRLQSAEIQVQTKERARVDDAYQRTRLPIC